MENHTLKLYNEFKGIFGENVTEYDVENYYDLKEFVEFLNQYNQIVATDNRTKLNIPFMKRRY